MNKEKEMFLIIPLVAMVVVAGFAWVFFKYIFLQHEGHAPESTTQSQLQSVSSNEAPVDKQSEKKSDFADIESTPDTIVGEDQVKPEKYQEDIQETYLQKITMIKSYLTDGAYEKAKDMLRSNCKASFPDAAYVEITDVSKTEKGLTIKMSTFPQKTEFTMELTIVNSDITELTIEQ